MYIMSVDVGTARTGVALSDKSEGFAFPKGVITEYNRKKLIEKLSVMAKELGAEMIVVGYPKNMDGSEGFRAERTRRFAEMLTQKTGIDCEFMDERLSTAEAYTYMNITGFSSKKRRGVIDTLSAQVILQSYIDRK